MSQLNVDTIINRAGTGAPSFPNGLTGTAATFTAATFTGNVSIAGTITYEDVTNVDSVGIITARQGIDIQGGIGATFADNVKAFFGTGGDLQIYHDGSNSFIKDSGTGNLVIDADNGVYIRNAAGTENLAGFNANGKVELYYDNVATFETISNGVKVKGGEGGQGILELSSDEGDDNSDKFRLVVNDAGPLFIQNFASGTWETNIRILGDGAVELYYDNDLHFATTSDGCKTNGDLSFRGDGDVEQILFDASDASLKFTDSKKAKFGTGDDLEIYHTGTDSYMDNSTGNLYIRNFADDKDIDLQTDNGTGGFTNYVRCDGSTGATILYHYGSEKFTTTSSGVEVTGTLSATSTITQNGNALATNGKAIAMALIFG